MVRKVLIKSDKHRSAVIAAVLILLFLGSMGLALLLVEYRKDSPRKPDKDLRFKIRERE